MNNTGSNAGSNDGSNAEFDDLIPLHALGVLEPDQVRLLEAYLLVNPEARASYVWYLEAVSVLARSVPLEEPPQHLKARMLDRVRQVNVTRAGANQASAVRTRDLAAESWLPIIADQTQPRVVQNTFRKRRLLPVAFAAMAAIVAGLFVQNLRLNNTLRALEASRHRVEFLLSSSQTRTLVLKSADGKTVVGVVLSAPDGGVLISHTMGDLSGTKTWQAWYILEGETVPRSLGTTNVSHLMIHVPVNTQAIALSEEPTGGSQAPTTVRAIATL